jgi:hypothetical protein
MIHSHTLSVLSLLPLTKRLPMSPPTRVAAALPPVRRPESAHMIWPTRGILLKKLIMAVSLSSKSALNADLESLPREVGHGDHEPASQQF